METPKNERQQADLSAMKTYPAIELEKKIEHSDVDVETLNLTDNEVSTEELERYNFLMETSKELYPGVCHYFIHTCVIEQIQEEKGIEIDSKNIEELRSKYDNNLVYETIDIKNFDDE